MVSSCEESAEGKDKGVGVQAQPVGAVPGVAEVIEGQRQRGSNEAISSPKVVALNEVASIQINGLTHSSARQHMITVRVKGSERRRRNHSDAQRRASGPSAARFQRHSGLLFSSNFRLISERQTARPASGRWRRRLCRGRVSQARILDVIEQHGRGVIRPAAVITAT